MKLTLPAAKAWSIGWWGYPGHKGQDYGWGDGDQVLAAAPGTVVEVYGGGGDNGGFGNRVVIQHAPDVYTTYNHLATGTILVSVGQSLSRGQRLATMGATGRATGKHLHFELELGGRGPAYRVDPAPYFTRDLPGTLPDGRPAQIKPAERPEEEDEDMPQILKRADGKDWSRLDPKTGTDLQPGQSRPSRLDSRVTVYRGFEATADKTVGDAWGRIYCRAYRNAPQTLQRDDYIAAQREATRYSLEIGEA